MDTKLPLPINATAQGAAFALSGKLSEADIAQAKKDAEARELRAVAEQFEALFVKQMLEQARKTKLADELFGGSGNETFRSMLDDEYAQKMADTTSLGIAEALVQQLGGNGTRQRVGGGLAGGDVLMPVKQAKE